MRLHGLEIQGTRFQVNLSVHYYPNGNLAIHMYGQSEDGNPFKGTLTKDLQITLKKNHAHIDINNNGEKILSWIILNRLAVPTGKTGRDRGCEYPDYHFKPERLQELDPDGYEEYILVWEALRSLSA